MFGPKTGYFDWPIRSIGKELVSLGRSSASPKWDGTRGSEELASPVNILHPSQKLYGYLLQFGKRSSLAIRSSFG